MVDMPDLESGAAMCVSSSLTGGTGVLCKKMKNNCKIIKIFLAYFNKNTYLCVIINDGLMVEWQTQRT